MWRYLKEMVKVLWVAMAMCFVAGMAHGVRDMVVFKYGETWMGEHPGTFGVEWWQWQKPGESWRNKYKDRDPVKGAKFPGSTTVFVWVTDAVHFLHAFQTVFMILTVMNYTRIQIEKVPRLWVRYWWYYVLDFFAFAFVFGLGGEIAIKLVLWV